LEGKTIQQFATGNVHSLILTDTLFSFGGNAFGQLGDGTNISQSFPVAVKLTGINLRVTMIAAGSFHTLFMTSDERLYAFRSNTFGDLGDGTNTDRFSKIFQTLIIQHMFKSSPMDCCLTVQLQRFPLDFIII
jgi:alpha-tubulin suppressor-like RCC1 family protein